MKFFKKAEEKAEEIPEPYIPPHPKIQDLAIVGERNVLFNGQDFELTDEIRELVEMIPIAQEKGLYNQVVELKKRTIASALSQKKMGLLHDIYNDGHTIALYGADGKENVFRNPHDPSGLNRFSRMKLKDYSGDMPLEFIGNIPKEIVGDASIFVPRFVEISRKIDPVVAVRLTETQNGWSGWYMALYWWL